MENGNHKTIIDYKKFIVTKFVPALFSVSVYGGCGCGATTLALLCNISPFKIKYREHWGDQFMIKFLRKHGFKTQQLTKFGVVESYMGYPIGKRHVILVSFMLTKKNASWGVVYGGDMYHNFEITSLNEYEFFNHPLLSAFLITHDKYNNVLI